MDNMNAGVEQAPKWPMIYSKIDMVFTKGDKMGESFELDSKASKLAKLAGNSNGIYLKGFGRGKVSVNDKGVVSIALEGRNGTTKVDVRQQVTINSKIDDAKKATAVEVATKATGLAKAEVEAIVNKVVIEDGKVSYKGLTEEDKTKLGDNLKTIQAVMRSVGGVKEVLSFRAGLNNFYISNSALKMSPTNEKIKVDPKHIFKETYTDGNGEEKTVERVFVKIKNADGSEMESVAKPSEASDNFFEYNVSTYWPVKDGDEVKQGWKSVGKIYAKNNSPESKTEDEVKAEIEDGEEELQIEDLPF